MDINLIKDLYDLHVNGFENAFGNVYKNKKRNWRRSKNNCGFNGWYSIKKLLALLIVKENLLMGKIEGYYSIEQKEELINKINEIIN